MEESLKQWTDVHGVPAVPSSEQHMGRSARRVWCTSSGDEVIEAISIEGMAHGVPIGLAGHHSYGSAGAFHFDVGISSTHHIASFWGIADELVESAEKADREIQVAAGPSVVQPAPMTAARAGASDEDAARLTQDPGRLDPRIHIAAALKAAGLLGRPSDNGRSLDPQRVIERTLRSVGLLKD
jgi:hypothetical protein